MKALNLNNNKIVAVLIPVYKEILTNIEILSLRQCFNILGNHPIIFVAPDNLNLSQYHEILTNKDLMVERFSNEYFRDIAGYNKLMLSIDFYKRFIKYKFILIYQLDAFVFKDELLYWCNQNFDYIGASYEPHVNTKENMSYLKTYGRILNFLKKIGVSHTIRNVGNGGLSLRKTKSIILLLKILRRKVHNNIDNEDGFFKYWGNIFYPFFKLGTDEAALKFSVETSPELSLKKLNYILPFGCHGFEKYSFETWKPYIYKDKL